MNISADPENIKIRELLARLSIPKLIGVLTFIFTLVSGSFVLGYKAGYFYHETSVCLEEIESVRSQIYRLRTEVSDLKTIVRKQDMTIHYMKQSLKLKDTYLKMFVTDAEEKMKKGTK